MARAASERGRLARMGEYAEGEDEWRVCYRSIWSRGGSYLLISLTLLKRGVFDDLDDFSSELSADRGQNYSSSGV